MSASEPPAPANVRFNPWKYLGLVALLFAALVGGWTWFLLNQGREGRDYARAALQAAAGRTLPAAGVPCAELLGRPLPSSVESCQVKPGTPPTAELALQGGRKGVLRGE
ncbi:hypothetical protein Deipr_1151 [Deinococcus proteolyticus MRP]|uniref:Uncharacterized protein n=1 Tax=Deinococcus proteolyticus (strain ATCC 35074 / DSM 20540 / JCM 6276 / NBRC 101906 / NCIMB 13154 / VKM Ac-1939 / CCM 2703 / MRP) TaxID=693977 RepID=F0RNH7_DEIPM|nr:MULTISPECIES: hypothetical protein [Deinococcus]ADY26303.1 hypothetical protein Deipr_1151 [Deinococcus proteolyticus MRP]MCY1702421.1 hypothetical protein [Deinococcus sp. SL84]